MSFAALAWAGKCKPGSASRKLVLLALADRHNDEVNGAYPSIAWLVEFTDLNRKTVINCLADLEALGLISDSGERRGDTRQIKLYRLNLEQEQQLPRESHYVYRLTDAVTGEFYVGVRSFLGEPTTDSYMGSGKWPTGAAFRGNELRKEIIATYETRTKAEDAEAELIRDAMRHPLCKNIAKEFQKRDRKQTVPKTDNSSKNDREQSQKRDTDTVRTTPSEAKASSGMGRIPDCWNEMAERTGLPKVRALNAERKRHLKARIAEHGEGALLEAIAIVERSDFCRGQNDRGWRADFDFILSPSKLLRVLEGKYSAPAGNATTAPLTEEARVAYAERLAALDAKLGRGSDGFMSAPRRHPTGPPSQPISTSVKSLYDSIDRKYGTG